MKIVFNCFSNDLSNRFSKLVLENLEGSESISTKSERALFDEIEKDNTDAYIMEGHSNWTQKAIDFIKRKNPYTPIVILMTKEKDSNYDWPRGAEFYILNPNYCFSPENIYEIVIRAIRSYNNNFEKLLKLTSKMKEEIEFEDFKYDPIMRNFRYNGKLIKKMSPKEGGVLEVLASNFGNVVKKEIIMERVWHKADFYVGRSMDVYITNIRNLFKEKGIPLVIKNIHNAGLLLDYEEKN